MPSESADRVRKFRERQKELSLAARGREEYIAHEVEITRAQMEAGLKDSVDRMGRTRLQRAEAYAAWRWDAYHAGEVHSL